jgi:hypothetical protein
MIYARERMTACDTLGSVHQKSASEGPLSDKMINKFAGQAGHCRQESSGLILDRAWLKT